MITDLQTLQTVLEDAVADAVSCTVADVLITAGRPAAPSAEGVECQTTIYLFASETVDFNQTNQDACEVRSRFTMNYEIWTCYPEDWYDPIASAGADSAADCLYELMRLVWCGLVDAKDAGTFGACDWVELEPLQVQSRLGGAVSALGGVAVSYDCTPETSPSSP